MAMQQGNRRADGRTVGRATQGAMLTALVLAGGGTAHAGGLSGERLRFTAAADTSISQQEPTESNGAGEHLFVGTNNRGSTRRALVRFDVSAIPAGSRVTDARLEMVITRAAAQSTNQVVTLRGLQEDFGEGTSDAADNEGSLAPATPGDSTWERRVYPSVSWESWGGTADTVPDATFAVDGSGLLAGGNATMADRVALWLRSPQRNHGWLLQLQNEEPVQAGIRLGARENATAANRPVLVVDFEPPPVLVDTTPDIGPLSFLMAPGNGRQGFGGPVGGGFVELDSSATGEVRMTLQRGLSGNINDTVVVYLDSVPGGEADTGNYTDQGDTSRVAISGISGSNRAHLTFPTPFRPDYAVAYTPAFGGFLFRLVANGAHEFVGRVADAGQADALSTPLTFQLAQVGLVPGGAFDFVVTYLSDTAFRSDEYVGPAVPAGNTGYTPVELPAGAFARFVSFADPCNPNPCQNNGTCQPGAGAGFACACTVGFVGPTCAIACGPSTCVDTNPCTADVCTATGCEHQPLDGTACTDGNACTDDMCVAGVCMGTPNGTCTSSSSSAATDSSAASSASTAASSAPGASSTAPPASSADSSAGASSGATGASSLPPSSTNAPASSLANASGSGASTASAGASSATSAATSVATSTATSAAVSTGSSAAGTSAAGTSTAATSMAGVSSSAVASGSSNGGGNGGDGGGDNGGGEAACACASTAALRAPWLLAVLAGIPLAARRRRTR